MGRRRGKTPRDEQGAPLGEQEVDPASRHISCSGSMVAVAVGTCWRVVDVKTQAVLHVEQAAEHQVRALSFSPDGTMLLTGSYDKLARVYSTKDWRLIITGKGNKKISAVAWSSDNKHCFFADRFGDVFAATVAPAAAAAASAEGAAQGPGDGLDCPAHLLLGHLQAIITSLTPSADGSILVSTDRDGKVRASLLPGDPCQGSYEVQSYCMGHTNFVTCSAAVPEATRSSSSQAASKPPQQQYMVSGGGDGTIRLWDLSSGACLAKHAAAEQPQQVALSEEDDPEAGPSEPAQRQQQQQQQHKQQKRGRDQEGEAAGGSDSDVGEEDRAAGSSSEGEGPGGSSVPGEGDRPRRFKRAKQQCAAVVSVAVSPCRRFVALAVEGQQELQLLQLTLAPQPSLQLLQRLSWPDVVNPSCVTFDPAGRLWAAGGALKLTTNSAHLGVAQLEEAAASQQFVECTAEALTQAVRSTLEQRDAQEEGELAAAAAAEAAGGGGQGGAGYYSDAFRKRMYHPKEIEERKKLRTDKVEQARLKALLEQGQQQQQQQ